MYGFGSRNKMYIFPGANYLEAPVSWINSGAGPDWRIQGGRGRRCWEEHLSSRDESSAIAFYYSGNIMKSWLESASSMEDASMPCMLADHREALLPITGRENLVPRKRDRSLEPCALSEEAYMSSGAGSPCAGLSREERRRRRRATLKYRTAHATRERIRVEAFNAAFASLRQLLPTLPPDKKLSKIEILRLAICYIAYLNHVLDA